MKKCRGFTLIELLVVIAIIGLLSTLAVISLQSAREKARDAKRVADIKQVQTALELYYNDEAGYPAGAALALGGLTDCNAAACVKINSNGIVAAADVNEPVYMGLIPQDPSRPAADECDGANTAVCNYSYSQTDAGQGYDIWFYLEGDSGSLLAENNCASENGMASGACP